MLPAAAASLLLWAACAHGSAVPPAVLNNSIAATPPSNNGDADVLATARMNRTLAEVAALLPPPFKMDTSAPLLKTDLLHLMFHNNVTIYNHFMTMSFAKGDRDGDGKWSHDDVKAQLRAKMGPVKFMFKNVFGSVDTLVDKEFNSLDLDKSGGISDQEFNATLFSQYTQPLLMPSQFGVVCDAVKAKFDQCAIPDVVLQAYGDMGTDMAIILNACRTGTTWIKMGFEVEKCILANATETSHKEKQTCTAQIGECLGYPPLVELDTRVNTTSLPPGVKPVTTEATDSSVLLKKRGIVPAPVTGILFALATPRIVAAVTLLAALAMSLLITYAVAALQSRSNTIQYYRQNTNFEMWMPGNSELPCNTPFIFWNDKGCGMLHSHTAQTCMRGQPYTKGACKWGWGGATRQCKAFGCMAMCMDVSQHECPAGMRMNTLDYDDKGAGRIVVPAQ